MVTIDIIRLVVLFHTGCSIRAPSIALSSSNGDELALWAVQDFKKGDSIGAQGYWGAFAVRKPVNNMRTVELGLEVIVPRQDDDEEVEDNVTKSLLVVGDVRCALTYVNDPTRGAAKRQKIQPNCRLICSDDREMMLRGNPSIYDV